VPTIAPGDLPGISRGRHANKRASYVPIVARIGRRRYGACGERAASARVVELRFSR